MRAHHRDHSRSVYQSRRTRSVAPIALLTLVIVLAILLGVAAAAAAAPLPGDIGGKVSRSDGGGVKGIDVLAYRDDGLGRHQVAGTTTGDGGLYTLTGLAPGTYWLQFFDPSGVYVTEFFNNKPTMAAADPVEVAAGQSVANINAVVASLGSYSGRITNAADKPISGIEVTAFLPDGTGGWQVAGATHSGADGKYSIGSLQPGAYKVGFADPSGRYLAEYYDNKRRLATATDVIVIAGQITKNVNAELAFPGSILGKVSVKEEGTGLQGIRVSAYMSDGKGHWDQAGAAVTQNGGAYIIQDLAAGTFRVEFVDSQGHFLKQVYNGKAKLSEGTDIQVVAGKATANIDAQLVEAALVTGKVTLPNGKGAAGMRVYAMRKTASGWEQAGRAITSASGTYIIGGLPAGKYRIKFVDPVGKYVTEYFKDRRLPSDATLITLKAGDVRKRVSARLALAGRVAGMVTRASGKPLAKILATAYFKDADGDWVWAAAARTSATGAYKVLGLAPGKYRVRFSDTAGKYATKFFRNASELGKGTDVTVVAGRTTWSISARLARKTTG